MSEEKEKQKIKPLQELKIEEELTDEEKIAKLEEQPQIPDFLFKLPTKEEVDYVDKTAEEIVKSNFFGEKNAFAAKIKVKACMHLKVDPVMFYKEIQIMEFAGRKVLTQSAYLMSFLILRSFPGAIKKQGWIGKGNELQFNMLVQRPGRPLAPFSFSVQEAIDAKYDLKNANWKKVPKDMTRSRCVSRCARTEFPDLLGGIIYTPEDFKKLNEYMEE